MAIGFGRQVWPVVSVRREGYRCKSQVHLMQLLKLKLGVLTVVGIRRSTGQRSYGTGEGATGYESSTSGQ